MKTPEKFIDSLVRIERLPETIYRKHPLMENWEIQYARNVGVAPDGSLRAMRGINEQSSIRMERGSDAS